MHTVAGLGDKKARYFAGLDVFRRFGFRVYGSGGRASMERSRASVRSCASLSGSRSSLASSAARSDSDSCLRLVMGVSRG